MIKCRNRQILSKKIEFCNKFDDEIFHCRIIVTKVKYHKFMMNFEFSRKFVMKIDINMWQKNVFHCKSSMKMCFVANYDESIFVVNLRWNSKLVVDLHLGWDKFRCELCDEFYFHRKIYYNFVIKKFVANDKFILFRRRIWQQFIHDEKFSSLSLS